MTRINALRAVLWLLVGLSAAVLVWTVTGRTGTTLASDAYGAPFRAELVQASAPEPKPFARDDMVGRPHAIFFGFTHCPDVCPTTLYEAGQWLDRLGPDAEGLDVYFVTVDPERDTPAVLADYLRPFDGRIKAVTGTPEQIADAVEGWNVYAKRVPLDDGGYTMDHTASVFLHNADGTLQGTIAYGEAPDTAVEKLRRLAQG